MKIIYSILFFAVLLIVSLLLDEQSSSRVKVEKVEQHKPRNEVTLIEEHDVFFKLLNNQNPYLSLNQTDEKNDADGYYPFAVSTPKPDDINSTETNLIYLEFNHSSKLDEYLDPYRELEQGQSIIILNTEAFFNKDNRSDEKEQDTYNFELKTGQDRIFLVSEPVKNNLSQYADAQPVGDPYFLEPGQYRISLNNQR